MVRTQIQLTDEQSRALKSLAAEFNVSVSELIRRSVENFIRSVQRVDSDEQQRRALAIVGQFQSGISDLSENHDKYLAQIYGEHKA